MIQINRLPEPERLAKNRDKWLAKFLEKRASKPDARPSNKQYGHESIRTVLRQMSHNKCFYCERKLDPSGEQVEHYRDVALFPEKAFDWNNLYLSCADCNKKLAISAEDCIDPCGEDAPSGYLTFDDEFVRPLNDSSHGRNTIKKYKLNRGELAGIRVRSLHRFERVLRKLKEQNAVLSSSQKEKLRRFGQPEQEFSLMFSVYLMEHVEID